LISIGQTLIVNIQTKRKGKTRPIILTYHSIGFEMNDIYNFLCKINYFSLILFSNNFFYGKYEKSKEGLYIGTEEVFFNLCKINLKDIHLK
jgi:hypothetical protein